MTPIVSSLLTTFVICLLAFTLIWRIHVNLKDAGIVDFYWAPGFAVIAIVHCFFVPLDSWAKWILLIAVIVWAARLYWHLADRHKKMDSEDRRYAAMREKGGDKFWLRSLFTIFWLQAAIMWLVASPLHTAFLSESDTVFATGSLPFYLGLAVFVVGFAIESIADYQLRAFREVPSNHNATLNYGLWAWSRHPNYFGESLIWFGIGLMGFAISGSLWSFAGPLFLTFILIKVSGTITEKHLIPVRKNYDHYIATTSAFIPRRPNRQDVNRQPAE